MAGTEVTHVVQRSSSGDAILSTSYADDYIIRGYGFNIQRRFTSIAAGATYKSVLDFSAISASKAVFLLPLVMSATGGPVYIKTYKISTYSGGTAITLQNLNETSAITPLTVFKHGITSTDAAGTDLREYELGSLGNPQQTNRSGSVSGASPLIFPGATKLCIEMQNNYSSAVNITVGIVLYEI